LIAISRIQPGRFRRTARQPAIKRGNLVKPFRLLLVRVCKPRHIPNKEAYKQAREVAKQVYIKHRRLDIVGDATLYHAVYVHPDWADKSEQIERIGSHIFYKE